MDGHNNEDPFTWDVETVARELSVSKHPCTKDPASLVAKVKEEEVDGRTLLTFEHTCSRQELMECLDIKLARHKSALVEAIVEFRSRSRGYQQWKTDFIRKQSTYQEELETDHINGRVDDGAPSESTLTENPNAISEERPLAVNVSPPRSTQEVDTSVQQHPDQERPLKRKRVAPIPIATTPTRSNIFIPTEADVLTMPWNSLQDGLPWEDASNGAYLGDGALEKGTIRSPNGVLSSRVLDLGKDDFATLVPNRLPLGRRLVVHRVTKGLLIRNSKQEMLHRHGMARMPSLTPSDDESILDLSDLPDVLDQKTLHEMEEERQDTERRKDLANKYLPTERVKEIIDEAISSLTLKWEESKLLKYKRKARRQWNDARRRGTKTHQILYAHKQAQFFDNRIKKISTEILDQEWQKEADVQNQARSLEQSLEDKLHQLWFADMLESRVEPPKPQTVSKPKGPVQRKEPILDEELLTSSDEDGFIEPGDESGSLVGDPMDVDSRPGGLDRFIKEESSDALFVDLTQNASPESAPKSQKKRTFIDLTSPPKLKMVPKSPHPTRNVDEAGTVVPPEGIDQSMIPSLESFGSVAEIGALNPQLFAKSNDRWRLVICMIWRLPHARRKALLNFIYDKRLDDAWEESVNSQMSDPVTDPELPGLQTPRLVAFDLTSLFLSFFKCRHYKQKRVTSLKQKTKEELEKARYTWFAPFCAFVDGLAPQFPQDSQIYTLDSVDDPLGGDVGDDVGDGDLDELREGNDDLIEEPTPTKRKPAPKEIIQNKDAVDLRERERQRQQDQDARRQQLRAQMVDSMPQNKARLIINETKQEDHSFIYFNEEIGKRIMDHQISGVRFMWNEIVLDAKLRQGCLLAHTMGLGKTMQVITLLVAIAEAATSPDPSVLVQIPEDLRQSQTLILCPPALVDNWMDELLTWAPDGLLGPLRKIAASTPQEERLSVVQSWAVGSGVLVIGHDMFKRMVSTLEEAEEPLLNKANIVVVDEAHRMKDPNSGLHRATSRFKTKTRIALTGSPLANNVEEYYQMINWVAPNFLGPLEEFKNIYATPIQRGLWVDSGSSHKRLALKKLEALKRTVAPKINRATIKMVKNDLPLKHEFVISVSPTPAQSKLYDLYIEGLLERNGSGIQQGQLFSITTQLALICNHPHCFKVKLKEVEDQIKKDDESMRWFPRSIIQPALKELNHADHLAATLSRKSELLTMILDEARRIGDKVLVFSQSRTTLRYLESLCNMQQRRYCQLHGQTPMVSRQDSVKSFNTGNKEVYLISTKAGGVGLNIQGANRVVIFDFQWNPVDVQQAVGRAYRLGQTRETFVYQFVVAGTFEENLQNRHVFKMQLSSRVVDKTNPISWSKRKGEIIHHIETKPATDLNPFLGKDEILDKLIGFKKDGEAIRSIVSTDTFEEEDPDAKLTVDERREVDEEVRQNRLRATDPEEYWKQKEKRERERQQIQAAFLEEARLGLQASHIAAPSLAPPRVEQTGEGHLDAKNPQDTNLNFSDQLQSHAIPDGLPTATGESSQHPTPSDPSLPLPSLAPVPVPLPLVGANTYFGEPPPTTPPASMAAETPKSTPKMASQSTPFKGGGLFSSPTSVKPDFEKNLGTRLQTLQKKGLPGIAGNPKEIARNFTEAVHEVRQRELKGFLHDNKQWRLLDELLQHDKLVVAMVSGHLTPGFMALASREVLQTRLSVINALPEEDLAAQAGRGVGAHEPSNLQNIERTNKQPDGIGRNPRATDDMRVLQEAAENRKQRGFRPPLWANRALSEEQGRAFPAQATLGSVESKRPGSRAGTSDRGRTE